LAPFAVHATALLDRVERDCERPRDVANDPEQMEGESVGHRAAWRTLIARTLGPWALHLPVLVAVGFAVLVLVWSRITNSGV
jgi:hypothetical protein